MVDGKIAGRRDKIAGPEEKIAVREEVAGPMETIAGPPPEKVSADKCSAASLVFPAMGVDQGGTRHQH